MFLDRRNFCKTGLMGIATALLLPVTKVEVPEVDPPILSHELVSLTNLTTGAGEGRARIIRHPKGSDSIEFQYVREGCDDFIPVIHSVKRITRANGKVHYSYLRKHATDISQDYTFGGNVLPTSREDAKSVRRRIVQMINAHL